MQSPQDQRPVEKASPRTPVPPGARLLAYFGTGAAVSILPDGLMLAVQADHFAEVVRLADFYAPAENLAWARAA